SARRRTAAARQQADGRAARRRDRRERPPPAGVGTGALKGGAPGDLTNERPLDRSSRTPGAREPAFALDRSRDARDRVSDSARGPGGAARDSRGRGGDRLSSSRPRRPGEDAAGVLVRWPAAAHLPRRRRHRARDPRDRDERRAPAEPERRRWEAAG